MPVVSTKALLSWLWGHAPTEQQIQIAPSQAVDDLARAGKRYLQRDGHHPNEAGHMQIARIVMHALVRAAQLLVWPGAGCPAALPRNDDASASSSASHRHRPLPKHVPNKQNGYDTRDTRSNNVPNRAVNHAAAQCHMGENLRALRRNASTSFAFDDEQRGKPGFVGRQVGSWLELGLPQLRPNVSVFVFVGYLTSYEHMGVARIACKGGCTCESTELDGHNAGPRRVSLEALSPPFHLAWKEATSAAQRRGDDGAWSAACTLLATVVDRTHSGEHKFKVTSVAISAGDGHAGNAQLVQGILAGNFQALHRTEAAPDLGAQGHQAYAHGQVVI